MTGNQDTDIRPCDYTVNGRQLVLSKINLQNVTQIGVVRVFWYHIFGTCHFNMDDNFDGKHLARAVVDKMLAGDRCTGLLGMEVLELDARRAVVQMIVSKDMVNGHGVCHGGMIFSLADTCCAFASNSENQSALLSNAQIDLLRPALQGDQLTATAEVVNQGKRKGIYDVTVVNQEGQSVAVFRGQTQRVGGSLV